MPLSGRACDARRAPCGDSLAILDREQARQPLWFANGFPLTPDSMAKASPAGARPGVHIAVSRCRDELRVWGTVRSLPIGSHVIEIVALDASWDRAPSVGLAASAGWGR